VVGGSADAATARRQLAGHRFDPAWANLIRINFALDD
jgi:hypothetical protein